ncbi:MAG: TatD family hydrolase [Gammaproteobacteria bacterium]
MLVDSHCHLDRLELAPYQGQLALALQAAKEQGIGHILCVCIDLLHFPQVLTIAEQYPDITATVGLHPNEVATQEPTGDELVQLGQHHKIVGIGETGLDYYRTQGEDIHGQQQRFRTHIAVAKQLKKPLIVHSRQAREDTISLLKSEGATGIGGVLHCFTEDWEMAKQALALNFYISFSGIITFRNAQALREVAAKIPLDRLLIETDAPYLAPEPYRGKSNEPQYVRYVAQHLADLKKLDFETVAEQTTKNFFNLFSLAKTA